MVWKLDRAFRSTLDALAACANFEHAGVGFSALTQPELDHDVGDRPSRLHHPGRGRPRWSASSSPTGSGRGCATPPARQADRPAAGDGSIRLRHLLEPGPADLAGGRISRRQAARRLGIGTATLGRLLAAPPIPEGPPMDNVPVYPPDAESLPASCRGTLADCRYRGPAGMPRRTARPPAPPAPARRRCRNRRRRLHRLAGLAGPDLAGLAGPEIARPCGRDLRRRGRRAQDVHRRLCRPHRPRRRRVRPCRRRGGTHNSARPTTDAAIAVWLRGQLVSQDRLGRYRGEWT